MQYYSSLKAKLIYIFTIEDEAHRGCVKIGEATLDEATDSTLSPNCKQLNAAARKRIDQYTKTAGIDYTLRHTELTLAIHGGVITTFNDKQVHEILLRSGIKRHDFSGRKQGSSRTNAWASSWICMLRKCSKRAIMRTVPRKSIFQHMNAFSSRVRSPEGL